jgi:hypothetical protein
LDVVARQSRVYLQVVSRGLAHCDVVLHRGDIDIDVSEIQRPLASLNVVHHLDRGVSNHDGRLVRAEFRERPQMLEIPRSVSHSLGDQFETGDANSIRRRLVSGQKCFDIDGTLDKHLANADQPSPALTVRNYKVMNFHTSVFDQLGRSHGNVVPCVVLGKDSLDFTTDFVVDPRRDDQPRDEESANGQRADQHGPAKQCVQSGEKSSFGCSHQSFAVASLFRFHVSKMPTKAPAAIAINGNMAGCR